MSNTGSPIVPIGAEFYDFISFADFSDNSKYCPHSGPRIINS